MIPTRAFFIEPSHVQIVGTWTPNTTLEIFTDSVEGMSESGTVKTAANGQFKIDAKFSNSTKRPGRTIYVEDAAKGEQSEIYNLDVVRMQRINLTNNQTARNVEIPADVGQEMLAIGEFGATQPSAEQSVVDQAFDWERFQKWKLQGKPQYIPPANAYQIQGEEQWQKWPPYEQIFNPATGVQTAATKINQLPLTDQKGKQFKQESDSIVL